MIAKLTEDLREQMEVLIRDAERVSDDVGAEVGKMVKLAWEQPLSREAATRLLTSIIGVLRDKALPRGKATAEMFRGGVAEVVNRLVEARDRISLPVSPPAPIGLPVPEPVESRVKLLAMREVKVGPVFPTPVFHGQPVPVNEGFVRLTDIELWDDNARLDIYLRQFQQQFGRGPDRKELLAIMLSKMPLPGVEPGDEFKIEILANSIAVNGVRESPILDKRGTLIDGNRRVAACYFILNSPDFKDEHKKRVEFLHVWQLAPNTTEEDRERVVVAMNFERQTKMEWPAYVRARRIHAEWTAMKMREPKATSRRLREMLVELAIRFAYGHDPEPIKRFLKMVDMADEFEDYHINTMGRDKYEVQHQANRYFEYFDELSKGEKAGGVLHTLNQNPDFKDMVFDLLHQNKIANFTLIRDLKYLDEEVKEDLKRAHAMPAGTRAEREEAQEVVERVLVGARGRNKSNRVGNANVRIETFVKWLRDVPISTWQDEIRPEVRASLQDALDIVNDIARRARRKGGAKEGEDSRDPTE